MFLTATGACHETANVIIDQVVIGFNESAKFEGPFRILTLHC